MSDPAIDFVVNASMPIPGELARVASQAGLRIMDEGGVVYEDSEAVSILWGACMLVAADRRGMLEGGEGINRDGAHEFMSYVSYCLGVNGYMVEDFIDMADARLAARTN